MSRTEVVQCMLQHYWLKLMFNHNLSYDNEGKWSINVHTSMVYSVLMYSLSLCVCVQDTISHMAKAYSFQYELVQYKWPRWLHQQTEKQRIIWGYKILFLDVLFPLAVDKIIFVDADQVTYAREKTVVLNRIIARCIFAKYSMWNSIYYATINMISVCF